MTPGQIASFKAACAEYGSPADLVVAKLLADMPADIVIAEYKVDGDNHVNAQLSSGFYTNSSARLRRIGELFGLEYAETTYKYSTGRLDLAAHGVIDGVNVRFWDNVPINTPVARVASCICACHGEAVTR